ncbi:MAG TPA: hypothetical protein VFW87_07245 [Pirellulales bacterium]|nr:hypothetical protein [Pirellulales bacterium]
MASVNLRAHFDGKQILLDEPFQLQPNARLLITVLPNVDEEHQDWGRLALQNLERAYGPDEPEYPLELIQQANPDYEGR